MGSQRFSWTCGKTAGPRSCTAELCCPKACPGPQGLPAAQPTASSPGAVFRHHRAQHVSPGGEPWWAGCPSVWLWLSLGPGDLEKMRHELLRASVPGLGTLCPGKPSTQLVSQMPIASPPPSKAAPESSAPLGTHGDSGVSTPMAEILSQRSTQNICSGYLQPNQHDG